MEIIAIAAVGLNGELGKDNQLLWHIPEDLKMFKEMTNTHAILMGSKTFESIGKPLPNRLNLVLSRDFINKKNNEEKDLYYFGDWHTAITFAQSFMGESKLFIIGGGEIYKETLHTCSKVYLTRVYEEFDADVYFPMEVLNKDFELVGAEELSVSNGYIYKFLEYERN
jgi:dihydrofolate reductase